MNKNYEQKVSVFNGTLFIITSVILFLGAIGIFIWLITEASEEHMVRNVLYGSAFLLCTLGLLIYVLFVGKAPKTCAVILWIAMILGAATFATGLFIKTEPCGAVTMSSHNAGLLSSELK